MALLHLFVEQQNANLHPEYAQKLLSVLHYKYGIFIAQNATTTIKKIKNKCGRRYQL